MTSAVSPRAASIGAAVSPARRSGLVTIASTPVPVNHWATRSAWARPSSDSAGIGVSGNGESMSQQEKFGHTTSSQVTGDGVKKVRRDNRRFLIHSRKWARLGVVPTESDFERMLRAGRSCG